MIDNKKVLHITYETLYSPNGVSSHVRNLADSRENTKVITIRNKFKTKTHTKEFNLNAHTKFNEVTYVSMTNWILVLRGIKKADVVHLHLTNFFGLLLLFISFFFKKKIVFTFHTVPILKPNFKIFLEALRVIIVYNLMVIFSSCLIILSTSQKNEIDKYILFRCPLNKKSKIINGFINTELRKKSKKGNQLVLLYVGRLEVEKGFLDFLKVLINLKNENVITYIVGEGSLVNKIPKNLLNIVYLGCLDNNQVLDQMLNSDILISCSHNEAFPVTILEAMSQWNAVVSTDLPTVKSFLQEGRNAYFFPVGDIKKACEVIKLLIRDGNTLLNLKENNHKDVQKFLLKNQLPLYLNIYNQ